MKTEQKKILVVEDEDVLLRALASVLEEAGFGVIPAHDGEEGLALALSEHPDLILLDIVMPKMDGMTVMKKLRENAWGKKVPIILLTNLVADDRILEGVTRDEPSFYLVKSDWKVSDVPAKVKERLGIED